MYDLSPVDGERPGPLRRFLFRDSPIPYSTGQVVAWWESRRIAYNVIVGVSGVTSLLLANVVGLIGPYGRVLGFPPLLGLIAVGVIANVCYTGGAAAELAFNAAMGRRNNVVGPTLFRYGTAFSVGLSLLPLAVANVELGLRILRWLF